MQCIEFSVIFTSLGSFSNQVDFTRIARYGDLVFYEWHIVKLISIVAKYMCVQATAVFSSPHSIALFVDTCMELCEVYLLAMLVQEKVSFL